VGSTAFPVVFAAAFLAAGAGFVVTVDAGFGCFLMLCVSLASPVFNADLPAAFFSVTLVFLADFVTLAFIVPCPE
jgi:hypothetical protein